MGCKYVKDFTFDASGGYSGSAGKKEVKTYMRGGAVKAPLDASAPKQTPVNMKPLRTANAKTAMGEANAKRVSGASGKISTAGQYAKGGMACGTEMKKGGKTKAAAKKSAPKRSAKKSAQSEDAMVEQLLEQVIAQASQTGRVPGVPMQGAPMPAPNARPVPVASQSPLIAMMHGGRARK